MYGEEEGIKQLHFLLVQGAVKKLTIDRAIVHFLSVSVQSIVTLGPIAERTTGREIVF